MAGITLIGAPMDCGKARPGCLMGPDAYRVAGIATALRDLGHTVTDAGNIVPGPAPDMPGPAHLVEPGAVAAWTRALADVARASTGLPIFMGGDHALALGSVAGMAVVVASPRRRPPSASS